MVYELHAVIVKKPLTLEKAKKIAEDVIKRESPMRETVDSYRFRNIPASRFDPKSFKTKIVNENVSLIFGEKK
tara:strand:- start:206 stop:424 length:219 start_codon:yes stop_codon:yes gene_type:complete